MRTRTIVVPAIALLSVFSSTGTVCPQSAQAYKGAQITVASVERMGEFHSGRNWLKPKGKDDELLVVRLDVQLGSQALVLRRSDVKLLDAQGKKYDSGSVVAVDSKVGDSSWGNVDVVADPKMGTYYLDRARGVGMTLDDVKRVQLFFGVPKGVAIKTLAIGNLAFDLAGLEKPTR